MAELQDVFPEIKANEGPGEDAKGNADEFKIANDELEKLISRLENGEFATKEDFEKVSEEMIGIKAAVNDAYRKYQGSIDEIVAQHIAAKAGDHKGEILAEVRETIGEMLQGQGSTHVPTADDIPEWVHVNSRADDHEKDRVVVSGDRAISPSTVLYASTAPPSSDWLKAADIVSPAQGSGTSVIPPYVQLVQADVFMADSMKYFPTDPHFIVPFVGGSPTVTKNRSAALTAKAADISNTDPNTLDKYESLDVYPNTTERDIPTIRNAVTERLRMAIAGLWAQDTAAVLKAATGTGRVATGAAAALPTPANVLGRMAALMGQVDAVYRMGAKFYMNEAVESLILGLASAQGAAFDITTGLPILWGYPRVVNSHLDNGGTAADVSAWFMSARLALTQAVQMDWQTRYYDQTSPGDLTFYSIMRGKSVATDPKAAARLVTAAT